VGTGTGISRAPIRTGGALIALSQQVLRTDASGMPLEWIDYKEAARLYQQLLPLINYENRQCGLRAAKTVLAEGKVIKSDAVRHPLRPLDPATRAGLLELAGELNPLALRWGK